MDIPSEVSYVRVELRWNLAMSYNGRIALVMHASVFNQADFIYYKTFEIHQ